MIKINKKIALSTLSILSALSLMAGSAFATLTSAATATGNTFSVTNPNLQVSTDNGTTFGATEPGLSVTGLIPGTAGTPVTFKLQNTDADSSSDLTTVLQLTASNANTLPGADLTIVVNCGGGNISDTYSGWITTGHSIGTVPHGSAIVTCTMTPTLNAGVGSADAGKSAIFDATFTGSVGS